MMKNRSAYSIRSVPQRILGVVAAGVALMTFTGCPFWFGVNCDESQYDFSGALRSADDEPLAGVYAEFWITHADGLREHDQDRSDSTGGVEGRVFAYYTCSDFAFAPAPAADPAPAPVHMTVALRGSRWSRTVSVPVSDDRIERDEGGVIESVDLGTLTVDPAEAPPCASASEAPLVRDPTPALESLVGHYHLDATHDPYNLVIREDATFSWDVFTCGAATIVNGEVQVGDDGSYLTTPEGQVFSFPVDVWRFSSFEPRRENVVRIRVELEDDGSLLAYDPDADYGAVTSWLRGRVCAVCDDALGIVGFEECCCFPGEEEIVGVEACAGK